MACDHCGETKPAMVAMMPGRDGQPWELCGPCWIEGRQPTKIGKFKVTPIADPHLYDALAAASERTPGLINMERARGVDDPKASVGNFDQVPPKRRRKAG